MVTISTTLEKNGVTQELWFVYFRFRDEDDNETRRALEWFILSFLIFIKAHSPDHGGKDPIPNFVFLSTPAVHFSVLDATIFNTVAC